MRRRASRCMNERVPTQASMVLLRRDGVVIDVRGPIPRRWIGHSFTPRLGAPPALRRAARRLVQEDEGWFVRRRVRCGPPFGGVEVLLVDAVPLRREDVSLLEIAAKAIDALVAQAHASRVDLRFDATQAADLPVVRVDADKLAWAVATLVGGALRYFGDTASAAICVTVSHDAAAGEACITVRDNGPGIPDAKLRALLRRNGNDHESLALVLLDDVVAAHGGQVMIESSTDETNHGTTVKLFLPTSPTRPIGRTASVAMRPADSGEGRTAR